METAIKIAIENGWLQKFLKQNYWSLCDNCIEFTDIDTGHDSDKMVIHEVLLDPLFWQAWTKGMGWDTGAKIRMCVGCGAALRNNEQPTMDGKHGGKNGCGSDIYTYEGQWIIEWHCFIDHLAEGKDIDSFFTNLLPKEK